MVIFFYAQQEERVGKLKKRVESQERRIEYELLRNVHQ
jgi:hypothetical protein